MSTEKFDKIKADVLVIVHKYKEKNPKGIPALVMFVISCVNELIELVESSRAVAKDAKKETVCAAIAYAYKEVDPDLPWIPGVIENKIEAWFLDDIVPMLIDWFVDKYNDKGIFDKSEDETKEITTDVSPTE